MSSTFFDRSQWQLFLANVTAAPRQLALHYFILGIAVLSYFSTTVSPSIAAQPSWQIISTFTVAFVWVGLIKLVMEPRLVDNAPVSERLTRQFFFDIFLYVLVGGSIALFNVFYLKFSYDSGYKVLIGCLVFGTFAGLDNALLRERQLFVEKTYSVVSTAKTLPITRKLFFAFSTVVAMTSIIMAMTLVSEVDYLLDNVSHSSESYLWQAILINIAFVVGMIFLLSLQVIRSYAQNLKTLFSMQIDALERVEHGNLDTQISVVTRDEFGLIAARTNSMISSLRQSRHEEESLLETIMAISMETRLRPLLIKIMQTASEFLNADRCTLFVYDKHTNELWAIAAEGLEANEVRFAADQGVAGSVFLSGGTLNITDAYKDVRFNQQIDKITGYKTKTILCTPVIDKDGQRLGVIQALNKSTGVFTESDEIRLKAFCAQAAIALVNARHFEEVNAMKNYNESILKSLSNGVITLDENNIIAKINTAAKRLLQIDTDVVGAPVSSVFNGSNTWILENIHNVKQSGKAITTFDTDIKLVTNELAPVNLTVVSLLDLTDVQIGTMLVFEDITEEKRVKSTMARYMTKEVADRLLDKADTTLGGTAHEVSVLFSDIRGFTDLSESLGARDTVGMLNNYFSVMADSVFNHNGILDKYIGDAIMAVFGAPFISGVDADNAVNTAIQMMIELKFFNERRRKEGLAPIDIGIGISTGEVIAGNIGSPKRMDYTVIGDTVNLASRLEGINKFYGSHIMITEVTQQKLSNPFNLREVGSIRVKGKTRPVAVFEVLDYHDHDSFPNLELTVQSYKKGLLAYQQRDWLVAINFFQSALHLNPADVPPAIYMERCQLYLEQPPPEDWDGVWTMEYK